MAPNDLSKWVTSDVDFYKLLGVAYEACSESELRRAYRKTALKYHPDKVGKDFDSEKYELFQAANEVLSSPELKAKYDYHRSAKIQKQRANELFEGRRRQMKEDLEARENDNISGGVKRAREDEGKCQLQQELRKLAEEGRKRRAARASMMAESVASSPAPTPRKEATPKRDKPSAPVSELVEDEVVRLERRIREAEEAKAKRKAEKKPRKRGAFVPATDSPGVGSNNMFENQPRVTGAEAATSTPLSRTSIFQGLSLSSDHKSMASAKLCFSPSMPTPPKSDFAATMARLKAAEKSRREDEMQSLKSGAV